MNIVPCERCGKLAASHDFTDFVTEAEIATRAGIGDFDIRPLDPISVVGVDGVSHAFHFCRRLLGAKVKLEAFEINDGKSSGYQFQMIGEPGEPLCSAWAYCSENSPRAGQQVFGEGRA